MGSWQSWLLGHRLIYASCCLSTFGCFPTGGRASAALSLGTREPKWGKGVGQGGGEAPGGLKRMGLREEVCRGQEPGYQWKEFVPNCTHCLSAPPPDSLYGG